MAVTDFNVVSFGKAGNPPILFVHGMAGSAALWVLYYAFGMMKNFHILAYDLRGHGHSPATLQGYSLTDQADDLENVRRHFGVGPTTVVGYSYGGHIATCWALRYPAQAAGLVIIDTPPLPVSANDLDDMLYGLSSVLGGDFSQEGGFLDAVKNNLRREIEDGRRAVRSLKARLDALKNTSFRSDVLSSVPFEDTEFMKLACRTLLIYATRGDSLAYAARQLSLIRNCRQVIVDAAHDLVMSNAGEIKEILNNFLHKVEAPAILN